MWENEYENARPKQVPVILSTKSDKIPRMETEMKEENTREGTCDRQTTSYETKETVMEILSGIYWACIRFFPLSLP